MCVALSAVISTSMNCRLPAPGSAMNRASCGEVGAASCVHAAQAKRIGKRSERTRIECGLVSGRFRTVKRRDCPRRDPSYMFGPMDREQFEVLVKEALDEVPEEFSR